MRKHIFVPQRSIGCRVLERVACDWCAGSARMAENGNHVVAVMTCLFIPALWRLLRHGWPTNLFPPSPGSLGFK